MAHPGQLAGSFRDPSGFVFRHAGVVYRQVNASYRAAYDRLLASGLCARLVEEGRLLPFQEAEIALADGAEAYRVIRPEPVPFVSYPYEWCFGQLRDAALLTLAVQKVALEHGMVLKDASAYNVQFTGGTPRFIDHLSFDLYEDGQAWQAYRQFCQHFLAPLALAALVDVRLIQLLRVHLDGVPLDLASRLLPRRSRLRFSLLTHIHLHARSQARFGQRVVDTHGRRMSLGQLRGLLWSLEAGVRRLRWTPQAGEWSAYYQDTNYTAGALADKQRLVAEFLARAAPALVWDLGGNVGVMSRLASGRGIPTVCFDIDAAAVEENYRRCRAEGDRALLPLLQDLTNPSPPLGWASRERDGLGARGPADLVMALALIHHLAISNNLPLDAIARELAGLGRWLILEFVPKEDSQVQRLLATRPDLFPEYAPSCCEARFARYFEIVERRRIAESARTLYLMRARDAGARAG